MRAFFQEPGNSILCIDVWPIRIGQSWHRCFLLQPAAAVFGALDRDIRFSSGELRSLCVDAVPYFLKEQVQTLS